MDRTASVSTPIASALDYFGLSIDEWRRTEALGAFIHPDDREQELAYFARFQPDGSGGQLELRLRGGDETYRWFLARYAQCAISTDKSCVGTWPVRISKTGSALRRDYSRKTLPYGRKSTKPRCLRRSLEALPFCKPCSRAFRRLHLPIPRFSSPARRERARSLSPALFTGDQIAPRAHSSV